MAVNSDPLVQELVELHKQNEYFKILEHLEDVVQNGSQLQKTTIRSILWPAPTDWDLSILSGFIQSREVANIFSIGCGTGLLEWLLLQSLERQRILQDMESNQQFYEPMDMQQDYQQPLDNMGNCEQVLENVENFNGSTNINENQCAENKESCDEHSGGWGKMDKVPVIIQESQNGNVENCEKPLETQKYCDDLTVIQKNCGEVVDTKEGCDEKSEIEGKPVEDEVKDDGLYLKEICERFLKNQNNELNMHENYELQDKKEIIDESTKIQNNLGGPEEESELSGGQKGEQMLNINVKIMDQKRHDDLTMIQKNCDEVVYTQESCDETSKNQEKPLEEQKKEEDLDVKENCEEFSENLKNESNIHESDELLVENENNNEPTENQGDCDKIIHYKEVDEFTPIQDNFNESINGKESCEKSTEIKENCEVPSELKENCVEFLNTKDDKSGTSEHQINELDGNGNCEEPFETLENDDILKSLESYNELYSESNYERDNLNYSPPPFSEEVQRPSIVVSLSGIEIDSNRWTNRYALPQFIKLQFANEDFSTENSFGNFNDLALFSYFNSIKTFAHYLKLFKGTYVVIIGPTEKRYCAPSPLDLSNHPDLPTNEWNIILFQRFGLEVVDHIAIYSKTEHSFFYENIHSI